MITGFVLSQGADAEARGDLVEAIAAYTAATQDPDPRVAAQAQFLLGRTAWRQARYDDALQLYERAMALAAPLRDFDLRASALNGIGAIHCERGQYAPARDAYQAALELAGGAALRGKILLNLGVIANIEGAWTEALELYARSADAFECVGDERSHALVLHNLGMLQADRHDWDAAEQAYGRCLRICERSGDPQMTANVLLNRTELLVECKRLDEALASCERALELFTRLGDEVGRAETQRWIARVDGARGRDADAERRLRETVRIAVRLQRPLLEAEACRDLGLLKRARGDMGAAMKWLRRAHDRFVEVGAERDAAEVRKMLEGA